MTMDLSSLGLSPQDILNLFEQSSSSQYEIQMKQIAVQKAQIDNQYKIAKLQAKTAQEQMEIDRWYKGEQLKLAAQAAELERNKFAFEQQKFNIGTGLDILKTGAQMGGPADYVQATNFARGVAANPTFSAAVQALLANQQLPTFIQPAGVPTPLSYQYLANLYGAPGGTTTPTASAPVAAQAAQPVPAQTSGDSRSRSSSRHGPPPAPVPPTPYVQNPNQTGLGAGGGPSALGGMAYAPTPGIADMLGTRSQAAQSLANAGAQLLAQGGQKTAPGVWESLTPAEKQLVASGIKAAGGDFGEWYTQRERSLPGQGAALAA